MKDREREVEQSGNWISVSEAGARLRLSYNQVLRLVLVGSLQGERRGMRWWVSAAAVKEIEQREHADPRHNPTDKRHADGLKQLVAERAGTRDPKPGAVS